MGDGEPDSADAQLTKLLHEFGPRLRAIVLARCPRNAGLSADEVEQEVRIRIWQTLRREKQITQPASYLYRTAMSAIIDLLRRRQARPDLAAQSLDSLDEGRTQLEDETSREAERDELALAVRQAVAALPERRRQPVQMHLQGFGFAEVAGLLRISDATARNLIYRGMDDLRELLRKGGWQA